MRGPAALLRRYADGLAAGWLSVPEVASAVINVLAEVADRSAFWAGAPAALRGAVMAYLAKIGAAGVPPILLAGALRQADLWVLESLESWGRLLAQCFQEFHLEKTC